MEIKLFNSNKKINIKESNLILVNKGQNLVDFYEYNDYFLKVINDVLNVNKFYKDLIKRIEFIYDLLNNKTEDNFIKISLENSLPIGYFLDDGKIFNKGTKNMLLLFKKQNYISLDNFLNNQEIFSYKRIEIYNKLIDLLIFFHENSVLLCDFKLDNFLVIENEQGFFITIRNIEKINVNDLKDVGFISSDFILPPEAFFKNEYNIYSELWLATNFIFYILTGLNVFDFIKAANINHNMLQNFLYHVDYKVKTWPPDIKQNINISSQLPYLDQIKYNNLKEVCKNYFRYSNFKEILFKNFILGYLLFNQRKNLSAIKNELKKDLVKYHLDKQKEHKNLESENKQFIDQDKIQDKIIDNISFYVSKNEVTQEKIDNKSKQESKFYKDLTDFNLFKRIEIESNIIYYQNVSGIQDYVAFKLKQNNILNSTFVDFMNSIFVFIPLNLDLFTYYKVSILFSLFSFIDKNQSDIQKKYNLDEKSFYYFKVIIVNFVQFLDEENLKKIVNIFISLYKDKSYGILIYFIYENLKQELLNIKLEELNKSEILKEVNMKLNSFISIKISSPLNEFLENYLKKIKIFVIIFVFILSVISSLIFFKDLKLFSFILIINIIFLGLSVYFILNYIFKIVLQKLK